jgi:hypothetical protein
VKQCHCKTSICYQTSATFQATHALTEYTLDELPADELPAESTPIDASPTQAPLRRTFRDIVGLSIQRAGGSAMPDAQECVQFARGVLSVNAELFPSASSEDFTLDAALPCDRQWVVQFHRGSLELDRGALERRTVGRDHADTRELEVVSFLFDARGNLIEIDHAAGS